MKTITKDELNKKINENQATQVINVLDPKYYNAGFIKGSKRIPAADLERRANELDKSKEVITYCSGYNCSASRDAAQKLEKLGFQVRVYEGGIEEWKDAGLPTEEMAKAA